MSKRAYGSAFLTPGGILATANGFGAPQPQVQQLSSASPTTPLFVPGQWPSEPSFVGLCDSSPTSHGSFFSTIGQWATTAINVANLFTLPQRLVQRFWRRQNIVAIPVVRDDGSCKKRLIDVGFADEPATPSPSVRARANATPWSHPFFRTPATLPLTWSASPSPVKYYEPMQITPSVNDTEDCEDDDSEVEFSLDLSFDDILTSTPPRNPQTGSPIHISWNSPRIQLPACSPSPNPATRNPKELQNLSTARKGQNRHALARTTDTPLRKHLLKLQLRRLADLEKCQEKSFSEAKAEAEAQTLELKPTVYEDSDLPTAPSSPLQTDVSSTPFQTEVEASPIRSQDSPAPAQEYENDLSFLSDAPSPPLRKSVRWAHHAGAKPFYNDEKVSEMLDSTLESIVFSPVRPVWEYHDQNEASSEDESQDASLQSPVTNENDSDTKNGASTDDGGFQGVPADTFDCSDESLEESQLSCELMEDLQKEMNKKMALAPPPPPPVQPLVAPPSTEEMETLGSAAKNTNYGKLPASYVVPEKLNAHDFATLLPGLFNGDPKAWLNDNIVNEYLSILVNYKKKEAGFEHNRGGAAPPIHAFSSFWYNTAKMRPKSAARWASKVQLGGKQYLDADLILYPICDGGHWRLLAVKPKERTIEYLDSLGFDGHKYVAKFKDYLKQELGDAWVEDEWTVLEHQRSTKQLNGSDCGVFTLMNALVLLRGEEACRVLSYDGMLDARVRIATTLMAGRPTTEME